MEGLVKDFSEVKDSLEIFKDYWDEIEVMEGEGEFISFLPHIHFLAEELLSNINYIEILGRRMVVKDIYEITK